MSWYWSCFANIVQFEALADLVLGFTWEICNFPSKRPILHRICGYPGFGRFLVKPGFLVQRHLRAYMRMYCSHIVLASCPRHVHVFTHEATCVYALPAIVTSSKSPTHVHCARLLRARNQLCYYWKRPFLEHCMFFSGTLYVPGRPFLEHTTSSKSYPHVPVYVTSSKSHVHHAYIRMLLQHLHSKCTEKVLFSNIGNVRHLFCNMLIAGPFRGGNCLSNLGPAYAHVLLAQHCVRTHALCLRITCGVTYIRT